MGKSADIEARELAFHTYYECGGNVEKTVRELKEKGYGISKPTLYDWIEKFNFKDRMAAADAKALEIREAMRTTEEDLLLSLLKQKGKYEIHFESQGEKIDNQAQYAYAGLVKTIIDIKTKIGADKLNVFIDFMKEFIEYLSREDQKAVSVIEKHLDGFADYARGKYGAK